MKLHHLLIPFLLCSLVIGCETERTMYRKIPRYYEEAGVTPGEFYLEDGTRVVYEYRDPLADNKVQREGGREIGEDLRAEDEGGKVEVYAMIPDHVLQHAVTMIYNEEYELMYDELLAERTQREYEERGGGREGFVAFVRTNRNELYAALNRMARDIRGPFVEMQRTGNQIRVQFHPSIVRPDLTGNRAFKFGTVDMIYEGYELRLLKISP